LKMARAPKKGNGYTLEIGETKEVGGKQYTAYFILDKDGETVMEGAAMDETEEQIRARLAPTLMARINNPRNYRVRAIRGKNACTDAAAG
jgi:hypothetical protein